MVWGGGGGGVGETLTSKHKSGPWQGTGGFHAKHVYISLPVMQDIASNVRRLGGGGRMPPQ